MPLVSLGSIHLCPQAARALLAGGADPNTREFQKLTPLHMAAAKGALPIVELLLSSGAVPQRSHLLPALLGGTGRKKRLSCS